MAGDLGGITSLEIATYTASVALFNDDDEVDAGAAGIRLDRPPADVNLPKAPQRHNDAPTSAGKPVAKPPARPAARPSSPPTRKSDGPPQTQVPEKMASLEDVLGWIPAGTDKVTITADTFRHKTAAVWVTNYLARWFHEREISDDVFWLDLASGRVPFIPLVTFALLRDRKFNFGALDNDRKANAAVIEMNFPRNVIERRFMNGDATDSSAISRLATSLEAPEHRVDVISTGMTLGTMNPDKITPTAKAIHSRLKSGGLWVIHDELSDGQHKDLILTLQLEGFETEETTLGQSKEGKWQGVIIAKKK